MEKRVTSGTMTTLILVGMLTLAFSIQSAKAEPTTWTVDDDGSADFSSIQEAINSPQVVNGDKIYVYSGTYYENVVVDKSLLLVGENRHTTIIDGKSIGKVVEVIANKVSIINFTLQNSKSGQWGSGLFASDSRDNIISDNIVKNNDHGIVLYLECNDTIVSGNTVLENRIGITIFGVNCTLFNNNMTSNTWNFNVAGADPSNYDHDIDMTNLVDGKPIYYLKNACNTVYDAQTNGATFYFINCNNITLRDLNLVNNDAGVRLWNTTNSRIENVTVSNNRIGINPLMCSNNNFSANTVSGNSHGINSWSNNSIVSDNNIVSNTGDGIYLYHSDNTTVSGNNIETNELGIRFHSSDRSFVYHNNFIDNIVQLRRPVGPLKTWDDGYPSGGNYWSDYAGVDEDHDGIGDTSHVIDVNNEDRYPLMEPWASPAMIKTLVRTINFWNQNKGTENSLTSKLKVGLHLLRMENEDQAIHKLMIFINKVEALRLRRLTGEQADYMIVEAQRIVDLIND